MDGECWDWLTLAPRSSLTKKGSSSEALLSARLDLLTFNPLARGVLNATMNFNAHVKFVTKELEKLGNPGATDAESDGENATLPIVDPSEAAERNELGRAAQAVCG